MGQKKYNIPKSAAEREKLRRLLDSLRIDPVKLEGTLSDTSSAAASKVEESSKRILRILESDEE